MPARGPTENRSHARAKETAALAKIPRSFLPCAGPDPPVSSQECRRMWADRSGPHGAGLRAPAGPCVPCQHACQPSCINTEIPGKAGDGGNREGSSSNVGVGGDFALLISFLSPSSSCSPEEGDCRLLAITMGHV